MKSQELKQTGFEWIGDIPADWDVLRLRATAKHGLNSFIDGDWIEAPFITNRLLTNE